MIIAIVLAIVAVCVSMVFLNLKTVSIEQTQLKQISADTTERKLTDQRIDNIITVHNSTVEHYDSEIDQIIARMDQITADIARIDNDEKELRRYYVNFRTPTHPNGGYTGGFVCKDDQDEQEDEHEQNDTETGR